MAFAFLVLVSHFCVKNIWALLRVEATIGWIGEGIVLQTANDMLPLSISFSELAWHALITGRFRIFGMKITLVLRHLVSTETHYYYRDFL